MNNPFQLLQMLKASGNPQQFVMTMLENSAKSGNPMIDNLLQCAKNNDGKGIEIIARNICKEKGVDFNDALNSFRNGLGL